MGAEVYAEDGYYAVIPEWLLDADVSAQAIRLYAVLRRYADQRTMHAHPSRRALAERLRVSDVKVVDRALADLTRVGAVTVYPRHTEDGDRSSNGYILHRGPQVSPQGGGPNAIGGGGPNAMTVGVEKGEEPQPYEPQPDTPRPADPPLPEGKAFEAFWSAYPRKVKKDTARKAWAKAVKRADPDKIVAVVQAYPFRLDQPQYIPYPATWLNAGSWEDDLAAVTTRPANGHPVDAAAEYRSRFHPDVPPWEIM